MRKEDRNTQIDYQFSKQKFKNIRIEFDFKIINLPIICTVYMQNGGELNKTHLINF